MERKSRLGTWITAIGAVVLVAAYIVGQRPQPQPTASCPKPVQLVERMAGHLEVGDDSAGVLVKERAGTREMNAATDFFEERGPHGRGKCLDLM